MQWIDFVDWFLPNVTILLQYTTIVITCCLSSVTRVYFDKTAEVIITEFSLKCTSLPAKIDGIIRKPLDLARRRVRWFVTLRRNISDTVRDRA